MKYYLPPLLWMAVIFVFSTSMFSSGETGRVLDRIIKLLLHGHPIRHLLVVNYFIRKTAHVVVYGTLAILLYRAALKGAELPAKKALLVAFFISMVFAATDEAHQLLVPGRTGKPADAALDSCGAAIALLVMEMRIKKAPPD